MRILSILSILAVAAGLMGAAPTSGDSMYVIEGHCSFKARAVRVVDTIHPGGGFGGHSELTTVGALPEFETIGSNAVTAKPGDKVNLHFKVGSYEDCGELKLNLLEFNFVPESKSPRPWVEKMVKEKAPATVTIDGMAYGVRPNTATNVQVFYVLTDKEAESWQTHIPTIDVKPGKDVDVVFSWTVPRDAPVGATFSLHVSTIGWTDVKTSQNIVPDSSPYDETFINVTVSPFAS